MFRYFVLFATAISLFNVFRAKRRVRMLTEQRPDLAENYQKTFNWSLLLGNLPLILVSIGLFSGKVQDIFEFARPQGGNPYVLMSYLTVLAAWMLYVAWVLFGGGAELMEKLDFDPAAQVATRKAESARAIKVKAVLSLTAALAMFFLMWKVWSF